MPVKYYQKKPVRVAALLFTGDMENFREMFEFTYGDFRASVTDNKDMVGEVYDRLHDTWIGVKINDVIIEGTLGEFYPHDGPLFDQNYFEVPETE